MSHTTRVWYRKLIAATNVLPDGIYRNARFGVLNRFIHRHAWDDMPRKVVGFKTFDAFVQEEMASFLLSGGFTHFFNLS